MERINQISIWLQSATIAGVVFRIIYCFIRLQGAEDESSKYKKRIFHAIIFLIISQLAFVIKDLITNYYQ
jgi:hypothetical protein